MQNKLKNRRKSRAIAMEIIYSDTVNEREDEITDEFLQEFAHITDTTQVLDLPYITRVVQLAKDHDAYIRDVIRPHLKDWTLERVSKVNLAILKIAATEILFEEDIPDRVSLNEALELSKIYSDEESTAFINGVLDKILRAKEKGTLLPGEDEGTAAEVIGEELSADEAAAFTGPAVETDERSFAEPTRDPRTADPENSAPDLQVDPLENSPMELTDPVPGLRSDEVTE